uniref:Uncharacterized protein n=1 Tax=Cacopsylla melanoneura TaxID=428564 RepID=A0A8D8W6U1_9HEMI
MEEEILERIKLGNRTRFSLKKDDDIKTTFKNKQAENVQVTDSTGSVIRSRAVDFEKEDLLPSGKLRVFENSVLRQIYGLVQENGEWRRRENRELSSLYDSPDIILTTRG